MSIRKETRTCLENQCSSTSTVSIHPLKAYWLTFTVIATPSAAASPGVISTSVIRTFDKAGRYYTRISWLTTAVVSFIPFIPFIPFVLWLVVPLRAWRPLMRG